MTSRRRIGIALAAMVVVLVAAGIGRSAWQRAQEPKYEGRTASEWLDYLATFSSRGFTFDEQARKEGEIAFRSMGEPGQRFLILEYLDYERPTGYRTNLLAWGEKLPSALRPRFLHSPAQRISVSREVLHAIRPAWEVFQPEVTNAFRAGGQKGLAATVLLGYVGRGGTNAAPLLVSTPTNASPKFRIAGLQALSDLGMNAAPALPVLISWAEQWSPGVSIRNGPDLLVLRAITSCGALAGSVVDKLNTLFKAATGREEKCGLAVAILQIDPEHEPALNYLEELVTSSTGKDLFARSISFGHQTALAPPNPAFARLAIDMVAVTEPDSEWLLGAQILLKDDPQAAVTLLRQKLANGRFNTDAIGAVYLLFRHDPQDPAALAFLERHIANEFFPRDANRISIVGSYQNCLPDSPGVVELLQSIQPALDDEPLRNAIRDTLRHIELNGKLRELRERGAAAGR